MNQSRPASPHWGRWRFIKSASEPSGYPAVNAPEIAIVGRSNAGKSSLLNALSGRKIAKVSSTPGKTTLINFFDCAGKTCWVDLPGYGYAQRSMAERQRWKSMVEDYLETRQPLTGLVLVMDIRRHWQEEEEQLAQWLRLRNLPLVVALTKADKVKQSEKHKSIKGIRQIQHIEAAFAVSSTKKTGLFLLEEYIWKNWCKEAEVLV